VSLEELVMFCSPALWFGGALPWRITHDPDRHGIRDLRIDGEPPPTFAPLRDEAEKSHTLEERTNDRHRVDWFFEVPLRLARRLTGFEHDEYPEPLDAAFVALQSRPDGALARRPPADAQPARRPWGRLW
jgi:hypothetical protein